MCIRDRQWDIPALEKQLASELGVTVDAAGWMKDKPDLSAEEISTRAREATLASYQAKDELAGPEVVRQFERAIMLQSVDTHWREHLASLDHLRQGIHLRGYAQKNPKQEYKREAFELFGALLDRIKHDTVSLLSRLQVRTEAEIEEQERERERQMARQLQTQHVSPQSVIASDRAAEGAAAAGLALIHI